MIEQCWRLVKISQEGKRWKCVDKRLPEKYQVECTVRHMIPRMIGGYILERTSDQNLNHIVKLRLGGMGNETYPRREFEAIDIEYLKSIENIENTKNTKGKE